jgi:hypothetical protein
MNRIKYFLAIVLLSFAASGTVIAQKKPVYGTEDDLAFADKLWSALEEARLLGERGVYATPHEGRNPHGAFLDTFTAFVPIDDQVHEVIVQRNYAGNQINRRAVADNPEHWLHAVSVMLKRPGYSDRTKDWYWVQYGADGSVLKDETNVPQAGAVAVGKSKGCIACHIMAPGGDMVFNHNRFSSRR